MEDLKDFYKAMFEAFDLNMDNSLDCKEIISVYKIIEAEEGEMTNKEIEIFK